MEYFKKINSDMYHVIAVVELYEHFSRPHTKDGVKSGYTPHHKFDRVGYLVSGCHDYGNNIYHFAGEKLIAKISFLSWDELRSSLRVGDRFEIREMDKLVGLGVVQEINPNC